MVPRRSRVARARAKRTPASVDDGVITPDWLSQALGEALDAETLVVEEAVSNRFPVLGGIPRTKPGTYFFCRGGGLGWGMPAACGVALAQDGPVLCVVGDMGTSCAFSAMPPPDAGVACGKLLPVRNFPTRLARPPGLSSHNTRAASASKAGQVIPLRMRDDA